MMLVGTAYRVTMAGTLQQGIGTLDRAAATRWFHDGLTDIQAASVRRSLPLSGQLISARVNDA